MIKHSRWQAKPAECSGSTVKGFNEPDAVFYHYPADAAKKRASVFRKLVCKTITRCASFIAGFDFGSRRTRNLVEDRP